MKTATHVLLRKPGQNFVNAIAQDSNHAIPDYAKTLEEYHHYAATLQKMGLNLSICEADESYPDGNFVEDTHLILNEMIIELNPGAESRAGEPMSLSAYLPTHLPLHKLSKAHTIDGGDILQDGKTLYVGLSARTQQAAIDELTAIVAPHGYAVIALPVPKGLHLKSGMTCMLPNHFIIQASFENVLKTLRLSNPQINYFVVPDEEEFAANVLPINGNIMLPKSCPKTKAYLAEHYAQENIFEVDTQQVRLVDGALTCSCLLFTI